jgi:hypothetical protein
MNIFNRKSKNEDTVTCSDKEYFSEILIKNKNEINDFLIGLIVSIRYRNNRTTGIISAYSYNKGNGQRATITLGNTEYRTPYFNIQVNVDPNETDTFDTIQFHTCNNELINWLRNKEENALKEKGRDYWLDLNTKSYYKDYKTYNANAGRKSRRKNPKKENKTKSVRRTRRRR